MHGGATLQGHLALPTHGSTCTPCTPPHDPKLAPNKMPSHFHKGLIHKGVNYAQGYLSRWGLLVAGSWKESECPHRKNGKVILEGTRAVEHSPQLEATGDLCTGSEWVDVEDRILSQRHKPQNELCDESPFTLIRNTQIPRDTLFKET